MPCSSSRYSVRTSSQLTKRIANSGTMVKIQVVTSRLAIASARKTCGMLQPSSCCSARPVTAAATMKAEFWMLRPAKTRAISCFGVRLWISANSGTMNSPQEKPMPARSMAMRQPCSPARKPAMSSPVRGASPLRAKYRSSMKALMPSAPSGTRPISTVRADSFSHSSEPAPTPTENSARPKMYSVVERSGAPRCSSA